VCGCIDKTNVPGYGVTNDQRGGGKEGPKYLGCLDNAEDAQLTLRRGSGQVDRGEETAYD